MTVAVSRWQQLGTRVLLLLAAGLLACTAWGESHSDPSNAAEASFKECDRQCRKLFEALQAWRRTHHGAYPSQLVQLEQAGLVSMDSLSCPNARKERRGASSAHHLSESRGDGLDPVGVYEYELSPKVDSFIPDYMGERITRREIKIELLRRTFWEQVPILRCSAHRTENQDRPQAATFRNFTTSGRSYWSGDYWEAEWPQVPQLCRQALVVRGLRGPPFFESTAPPAGNQLDLRSAFNARAERAWWWGVKYIDTKDGKRPAPDLSQLMADGPRLWQSADGITYALDGVIQLQGKVFADGRDSTAYAREVFPWKCSPIAVERQARRLNLLMGCVWEDKAGRPVGSLVWGFSDGREARTPLIYGEDLRRFWSLGTHKGLPPTPAFESAHDRTGAVRVYSVPCENPRPEMEVTRVWFESNHESAAAPFILAMTLSE